MVLSLEEIYIKSSEGGCFSREECHDILNYPVDNLNNLLDTTLKIRQLYWGKKVSVQILTNARSGDCSQNCAYCAQSCLSKADINKYSLIEYEQMLNNGKICLDKKVHRHCIGFSGISFTDEEVEKFCLYIERLKREANTRICCSIGFLTEKQATKLKNAGVGRINHNLNTGKNFYHNICTTHTYEQRVANIQMLKKLGFEMCCGGIVGLGESDDDLVDMLLDIKKINPESIPINFLLPLKGTPLEFHDTSKLTTEYCLKVLSLTRLLNPKASIRCAAGREVYFKDKQNFVFYAVNSIFASGYLTATGQNIDDTVRLIQDSGFEYEME
ncbi:MAG: biotin synthase BioB [Rickettsiales bacterium]|jgi:biotin synthase|nr:biotin synthase BioB [Rickettsiales bacterium]